VPVLKEPLQLLPKETMAHPSAHRTKREFDPETIHQSGSNRTRQLESMQMAPALEWSFDLLVAELLAVSIFHVFEIPVKWNSQGLESQANPSSILNTTGLRHQLDTLPRRRQPVEGTSAGMPTKDGGRIRFHNTREFKYSGPDGSAARFFF
jgi:hypothetical protein